MPADSCKIPRQFGRGGYEVLVGSGGMPSKAFVAEEEKCLLLMLSGDGDWTAKSRTELILLELGLVGRLGLFGRREAALFDSLAASSPYRQGILPLHDLLCCLTGKMPGSAR